MVRGGKWTAIGLFALVLIGVVQSKFAAPISAAATGAEQVVGARSCGSVRGIALGIASTCFAGAWRVVMHEL